MEHCVVDVHFVGEEVGAVTDASRRKQLKSEYRQSPPEAGVYRFVNTQTGRFLVASTTDLASIRNKLDFARSTGGAGVFDYRMKPDIKVTGIDAISLDILETLDPAPTMTADEIKRDLATLVELWREKLGPDLSY